MDGGARWATVLGVAKSRTQLSDFAFTFHHLEDFFLKYLFWLHWVLVAAPRIFLCGTWASL